MNLFHPVRPPFLLRRYYSRFTWRLPESGNKVYLTFDDGPVPEATPFVLDTLNRFRVKGTFFCIGDNVQRNPELFIRLHEEGHRIGNHTQRHLNGWQTPIHTYLEDVEKASVMIPSRLFRPPYGRIRQQQAEAVMRQFSIIMWDVLSYDFDSTVSQSACLRNVTGFTRPGSIVVFHDSAKAFRNLEYTLPRYIDFLLEKGYEPDLIP